MTIEEMRELLTKDEKITVEYKACQNGIHDDVYETVCSFSNRYGGYIIMGVEDGGKPIGINKKLIKDMKKNFVSQLNNPDKMSPTLYLSIEEIEYEGMTLLWVFVPPTSTVEKCANRIYDRNEDGDMDITDSPIQLQNLYNRKSNTYAERKIFPYVTTADLRLDLLEKVIIEKDWLKTENWCIPRRHGNIMQDEFQPYPKNPIIQRFFANIGRTDTIGSGVINLYKYTPIFSDGGKPELFEDDVFKITIPLNKEAAKEASDQKKLSDREQAIYNLICENKHLTVEQVMAEFDISRATVFRDYAKIKKITGAVYDKNESVWKL